MKIRPYPMRLLGLSPLAFVLCGCDGNQGVVAGTVRFQGQALKTGYVTFTSDARPGVAVSSLIHEDGTYVIRDCPPGPAKITVKTVVPRSGQGRAPAKPAPAGQRPIPARYAFPDTSQLTCTVRPGTQEHDIDLSP